MQSLDIIMRKKSQLDKRNKAMYGGKGVFPSHSMLEKLADHGGRKGVSFKEWNVNFNQFKILRL